MDSKKLMGPYRSKQGETVTHDNQKEFGEIAKNTNLHFGIGNVKLRHYRKATLIHDLALDLAGCVERTCTHW